MLFCGLYKSMRFSMRPIEEIIEDIEKQAQFYKGKKIISCFLQDGDAAGAKDRLSASHFGNNPSIFSRYTIYYFLGSC